VGDIQIDYGAQFGVKKSLSRIWEGDEESECRYSIDDKEDEAAAYPLHGDDVSSESSLDDDFASDFTVEGSQRNWRDAHDSAYFNFEQFLQANYS